MKQKLNEYAMNGRNIGLNTNISNCSTSNSSESTSLYETPINSPPNESLLNSITIDSIQTDRSQTINNVLSLSSCHSFESLSNRSIPSPPISIQTNSTLKANQFDINSSLGQNVLTNETLYQPMNESINMSSIPESSIWFRRTGLSTHDSIDSNMNNTDKCRLLMKFMAELDSQQLQIIGIEQQINSIGLQINSISLQCKAFRENIVTKTNNIFALINDIFKPNENTSKTQTLAQRETQTIDEELTSSQRNQKSSSSLPKSNSFNTSRKDLIGFASNVNSVTCFKPKQLTDYPNFTFKELSGSTKKNFERLPAFVKGFLTRRLMNTEKVVYIKNMIRDTTQLLLDYKNSPPNREITVEDIKFHKRLIIQLENACHEFYDILINYPKSAQMGLIRRSCENGIERQYRTASVLSTFSNITSNLNSSINNSITSGLSSVTKKRLEKKLSIPNASQAQSHLESHSQSHSQIRPNTTVAQNNPKKNTSNQSVKTSTQISLSIDSNNRINTNVRRSQRNVIKPKPMRDLNSKRKSTNKLK